MVILAISNIFLWLVVLAMGIVIYALTRQVGVLYERVAPAGALALNQKLKVGDLAPEMVLQTIDSKITQIGGVQNDKKSLLVFFASPDCPMCKTLMPAVISAAKHESDWVNLIIASDGMEQNHQGYREQQRIKEIPYLVSELLGKTYGVSKLPYAVLIDEKGSIAAAGIVNSREHIDSLFEAKEKNIASLQEYMNSGKQSSSP